MKLTDLLIRALLFPPKGQKTYWDDALQNFGCRVSQGGTKSFVVQHGPDRRLITIGRYPIISLAAAREEAKRLLAEITLGQHRPRTARWDDALEQYLAACEEKNRKRTVDGYRRLINRHFQFKRQQLGEITSEDIERMLRNIKAPAERNHALVAVKVFLGWCQKPPRRYIAHNPCEGMVPTKRKGRKRILTDLELAAIYSTALEGTHTFSHIVALLVLNGQRRTEIASLRKTWCNASEQLITLPEHITKNKMEHTFPYGPLTAGILQRRSNFVEGDLYFPPYRTHVRGKPTTIYAGWSKDKKAFDKLCGVTKWTLHDLRRTFATRVAELGVLPHVVERLLNHRLGAISNHTQSIVTEVAEVYNLATFLPEMHKAIDLWEQKLIGLLQLSKAA
jgi:integrase